LISFERLSKAFPGKITSFKLTHFKHKLKNTELVQLK
jgi:hypothetical protein